jgi:CheY-like chemotaxis protein
MSFLSQKRVAATSKESTPTRNAVKLPGDQARLDRDRELAIPSDLVGAAVLRERQRDLDRSSRPQHTAGDGAHRSPSAVQHEDQRKPLISPAEASSPARVEQSTSVLAPVVDYRPRLIIADDDPVVVAMLEGSLSGSFDVVGVAADSEEVIELARVKRPDAALVDVDMPKGGGLAAVKGILDVAPDTAIVVLSSDESDAVVRDLMEAGAIAYRRKGGAAQVLADSLTESIAVRVAEHKQEEAP